MFLFEALLSICVLVGAGDPIVIDQQPATVDHVNFNPNSPPDDMPKLGIGEAALTRFEFGTRVAIQYEIVSQKPVKGGVEVTAKLTDVNFTINLSNRVFLPMNATTKLRAHEEGHRECNERCYKGADHVARRIAEVYFAKTWTAVGPDSTAAGKLATDPAMNGIAKEYNTEVAGKASRIGDLFDELTDHGRNNYPVAKAIERAFSKYEKERATTKPN